MCRRGFSWGNEEKEEEGGKENESELLKFITTSLRILFICIRVSHPITVFSVGFTFAENIQTGICYKLASVGFNRIFFSSMPKKKKKG